MQNHDIFIKKLPFRSDYLKIKNHKKSCYYFLLILGMAFIVPSQCSFLKLQFGKVLKVNSIAGRT